jgi:hypothetical protein
MTKIEEVARIISDSLSEPDKCGVEMCGGHMKFCICAMDAAKAAIEAMRERAPDQKIIDAMSEVMAEVGQPCDDELLLKLGRSFIAELEEE